MAATAAAPVPTEGSDATKTLPQPPVAAVAADGQDGSASAAPKAKPRRVLKRNLKSSQKAAEADASKTPSEAAAPKAQTSAARGKGRGRGRGNGRKTSAVVASPDAASAGPEPGVGAATPDEARPAVAKRPAAAPAAGPEEPAPLREPAAAGEARAGEGLALGDFAVVVGLESEEVRNLNGITGYVAGQAEEGKMVSLRIGEGACLSFKADRLKKLALKPFECVRMQGLSSEVGRMLNGVAGVVKGYSLEKDRYEVRIGGELRTFRAENLTRLSPDVKALPGAATAPAGAPAAEAGAATGAAAGTITPASFKSETTRDAKPILRRPAKAIAAATPEAAVEIAADCGAVGVAEAATPVLRRPAKAVSAAAADASGAEPAVAGAAVATPAPKRKRGAKAAESAPQAAESGKGAADGDAASVAATPAPKRKRGAQTATEQKKDAPDDAAAKAPPSEAADPATPEKGAAAAAKADSASKPAAKRRRTGAVAAGEAKADPAEAEADALGYGAALRNLAARDAIIEQKISTAQMLAALKDAGGLVNRAKDTLLSGKDLD